MNPIKREYYWIASEAEFYTKNLFKPKKERVALVYALKINVINDGSLKMACQQKMLG